MVPLLFNKVIVPFSKIGTTCILITCYNYMQSAGADPGFQVKGGALKKSRRAEGGAKILGYFV